MIAGELSLKMAMTPQEERNERQKEVNALKKTVQALEKAVQALEKAAQALQDANTETTKQFNALTTELTLVAGEVQTLAGLRAIVVAAQVLFIHIGKQQRIPKNPRRYFKIALHDPNNPDYRNMLESVFGAVDSIFKI